MASHNAARVGGGAQGEVARQRRYARAQRAAEATAMLMPNALNEL